MTPVLKWLGGRSSQRLVARIALVYALLSVNPTEGLLLPFLTLILVFVMERLAWTQGVVDAIVAWDELTEEEKQNALEALKEDK